MRFSGVCCLVSVVAITGCASSGSPEVSSYAQWHTGLENKLHEVSFYGDRPTKSYVGLQSEWTTAEDLSVAVSVEGTLNRKTGVLGKNDVPFDRTANFSLAKDSSTIRFGRSKMLRAKYSLTSSMRSYSSALREDYPIDPIRLGPYLSETLASSLFWQRDSDAKPLRMQLGNFDGGTYGAAEVGWSGFGVRNAMMFENARFDDPGMRMLQQLSYNGVLEDEWGWNAWEVWGAQAEGSLLGGRLARGFETNRLAMQLSLAGMRQGRYDFSRRYFYENDVVGRSAWVVAMDLLWEADRYNEFSLSVQNAGGVVSETPLEDGILSDWTSEAQTPRSWQVGLSWARRAEDDSVWTLSASMMNSRADNGPESYLEWGTQGLWEIPLGQRYNFYMGTALGQGGYGGDLADYAECYIGLQSVF